MALKSQTLRIQEQSRQIREITEELRDELDYLEGKQMESLTSIQEEAIAYLHSRTRKNDHRVKRTAGRMVRDYCTAHGYSEADTNAAIRDMWDVYKLESDATA